MKTAKLDPAGKSDALSLAHETLSSSYEKKQADAVVSFLRERIAAYETYGVYDEDRLCAFIVYDPETFRILFLLTGTDARGKGCGTLLLDEVKREAEALSMPRLSVNAPSDLYDFLKSYGFEETAEAKGEGRERLVKMEYLLGRQYIGKTVTVIIDRPWGSFHLHHPDVIYPLNCGYVDELAGGEGEFQDAYVYGVNEPLESFTGTVSAIVYRMDGPSRFIVTRTGETADRQKIIDAVAFEEQYYDTRFIWNNALN